MMSFSTMSIEIFKSSTIEQQEQLISSHKQTCNLKSSSFSVLLILFFLQQDMENSVFILRVFVFHLNLLFRAICCERVV